MRRGQPASVSCLCVHAVASCARESMRCPQRVAVGIWGCKHCNKSKAGGAYVYNTAASGDGRGLGGCQRGGLVRLLARTIPRVVGIGRTTLLSS